jgi:hypothetical protein
MILGKKDLDHLHQTLCSLHHKKARIQLLQHNPSAKPMRDSMDLQSRIIDFLLKIMSFLLSQIAQQTVAAPNKDKSLTGRLDLFILKKLEFT